MGIIDGVGVLHQRPVDEVGALVADDVEQSEGELQFGNELEEGKIHVAAHAHLDEAVERLVTCGWGLSRPFFLSVLRLAV